MIGYTQPVTAIICLLPQATTSMRITSSDTVPSVRARATQARTTSQWAGTTHALIPLGQRRLRLAVRCRFASHVDQTAQQVFPPQPLNLRAAGASGVVRLASRTSPTSIQKIGSAPVDVVVTRCVH